MKFHQINILFGTITNPFFKGKYLEINEYINKSYVPIFNLSNLKD